MNKAIWERENGLVSIPIRNRKKFVHRCPRCGHNNISKSVCDLKVPSSEFVLSEYESVYVNRCNSCGYVYFLSDYLSGIEQRRKMLDSEMRKEGTLSLKCGKYPIQYDVVLGQDKDTYRVDTLPMTDIKVKLASLAVVNKERSFMLNSSRYYIEDLAAFGTVWGYYLEELKRIQVRGTTNVPTYMGCFELISPEYKSVIFHIFGNPFFVDEDSHRFFYLNPLIQRLLHSVWQNAMYFDYHGVTHRIRCSIFSEYREFLFSDAAKQNELVTQAASKEIESSGDVEIFLYNYKRPCKKHPKSIISVWAEVACANDNVRHPINVQYCIECKKYYINVPSYLGFAEKYGLPILNIIYNPSDNHTDYHSWNAKSKLASFGYSAGEDAFASDSERQHLLALLIDTGAMQKVEIVNWLEFLISTRQKVDSSRVQQRRKDDLLFVSQYNLHRQPCIIGEIKYEQTHNRKE